MTECNICGYKIHVNKNLDQSFIILKNEINLNNNPNNTNNTISINKNFSFDQGNICFECISILYKQLQKQKECEIHVNTHLTQILEETPKSSTNYTNIINTLQPEYNNLEKINNHLEEQIAELEEKKQKLQIKKRILDISFNRYWELRNEYEYKLTNT